MNMRRQIGLLGRNTRRLRLARGMTKSELARKTDISPYVLSRAESGNGNPSMIVVFRLARALGVHPADLCMDAPPRGLQRRK